MADLLNELFCPMKLTGIAASLTDALGVDAPKQAESALEIMKKFTHGKNIDRVLMYNPDAVGLWLFGKYTDIFEPVMLNTQLALPLETVMPSVTPVCFATMYTGVQPEVHGIRKYEKPVLTIETIFDVLVAAGKKVAIITAEPCSISRIFLEREVDYYHFEEGTLADVNAKAAEVILRDEHDFIVIYNGNYDSVMHKMGPESANALSELRANDQAFSVFASLIKEHWKNHNTLLGFAMDHGCHEIDGDCGSHGLDMPEDINIVHLYKGYKRESL